MAARSSSGMAVGLAVTMAYFVWTLPSESAWFFLGKDPIWDIAPVGFGLIGMLMGWWRVKISSGCP